MRKCVKNKCLMKTLKNLARTTLRKYLRLYALKHCVWKLFRIRRIYAQKCTGKGVECFFPNTVGSVPL